MSMMIPSRFPIEGFRGSRTTTQAMGEDGGMVDPIYERTPEDLISMFKERRGGGGATTRALGEDDSGGMIPNFGGMMTMAIGEESGGLPPMSGVLPNTVEPGQGLLGSMMTQAMGEQEGDMMPPSLIADFGPPSGGGNNFSTMAVGEESGGFEPPMFTTAAVGEDGGGGDLLPEPFEPPSQSRTTELIEELISLLRGSRSPPSAFDRPPLQVGQIGQPTRRAGGPRSSNIPLDPMVEMSRFLRETSNPMQQAAPRPPPRQQPEVSGIGTLNDLASNPLFQDFATQLQSSNPRQSDVLGNLFQQANKSNQRQQQNQFQPQSNPFMSDSSPFMAPPQFFSPQAYGQFAPPPMGFSQFQPPIPYGSSGGFAPPPPQFAPMQQGRGDSSPFANSIRSGALSTFALQ